MKINLRLKKFQTQKFVNEYFAKKKIKMDQKSRTQTFKILKKSYKNFEWIYVKNFWEKVEVGYKVVEKNVKIIVENVSKTLEPVINFFEKIAPKYEKQSVFDSSIFQNIAKNTQELVELCAKL